MTITAPDGTAVGHGCASGQPSPDTAAWTTPAGRTHLRGATVYDL